jgi:hypothetical protein
LAVIEDLGQGKGQNPNHDQHHQSLRIALVQRRLLESAFLRDGLKNLRVNLPATRPS